jgi:hypothetical protein
MEVLFFHKAGVQILLEYCSTSEVSSVRGLDDGYAIAVEGMVVKS